MYFQTGFRVSEDMTEEERERGEEKESVIK